ncbi:VOC family protein [Saccharopolyspora sp. K220]|uniref:VOC family protein n=1 Tax=Saccharopolyspora soli TaxID=2926618 RepID=UPI001F55FCC2|nr:VOC family protein [Saccharopolyspora soli]MCI2420784.1 VOC family protein [Saccharopolyspora soli]
MAVQLNHTIVAATDKIASARFLADLLGLPEPEPFGPFVCVQTSNDVTLDYLETDGEIIAQHYAFLVSEAEFDEIFGRIKAQQLAYWADPAHQEPGRINTRDGGRGVYFDDPDGHILEILTRPYGSGG